MEFVIIGGDAAGMSAASRAKRRRPDIDVTVFEQTDDVSYSACGMPYNLADPDREMDDLVVRPADVFRERQGIRLLTGRRVDRIDPAARTVTGTDRRGDGFRRRYDRLLLATGARPVIPDLPGVDRPGVMALKNLADGRRIKRFLRENRVRRAVILGMGYIALEMCEALHARGIAVDMVKPRPDLLPWMAAELSGVVRGELERHGVGIYDGRPVERIEREGDRLTVAGSGLRLAADMALVAIGVHPNAELAAEAGLALGAGGAVAVDDRLRTSDARIFAAGDCADAFHAVHGGRTYIPLALRANRGGWAAADNACGGDVALPAVAGTAVFKVFDLQVARTGLSPAEAAEAGFAPREVVVKSRSRAHAHPGAGTIRVQMVGDGNSGRLLGVQMVGREGVAHRINAAAVALQVGMTVAGFAGCDLAYAPPFGPTWDPLLVAANQLLKRL